MMMAFRWLVSRTNFNDSSMADNEIHSDDEEGESVEVVEAAAAATDEDSKRSCWVCYAADEDDLTAAWVQPCRCRGTTKWVHQSCIQRWVDEKQKGNWFNKVSCPQCNTEYLIVFPGAGRLVLFLDYLDNVIYRVCPFVAAGIVLGSIYWTAVSYGGITVLQVLGHKEGLAVMETADPLMLLVGLPTIPVVLVLMKLIRWEDHVVRFLRRQVAALPVLGYLLPSFRPRQDREPRSEEDRPRPTDPISTTRVLCSALILPTAASLCGNMLFESSSSNLQRTLLGGVVFIGIKGILRVYHKQQQHIRQEQRTILNFQQEPPPPPTSD